MTAARDNFGANSIIFVARSDFDGQRTFDKGHDPFQEERVIVYAEKAQSLGLKPYLQNTVVPGYKNSDGSEHSVEVTPANLQNFLDGVAETSLKFARLADRKNVPQFSPFTELSLHTSDAGKVNAWISELVPQLRQAYGGELSPNLLRPEVERAFDFSGFDSIGIQANGGVGSSSDPTVNYNFVRSQITKANEIAAKNGLGRATISEMGVPLGINGIMTQAEQKALMEVAFAASDGLARGRYVAGFGDAVDYEWSVIGKPAGKVVQANFGGSGPNGYEDKKPAVMKTIIEAGVY